MLFLGLILCAALVAGQHNMGQFTGSAPTGPFVPPANGGSWWPPQSVSDGQGGLLPNPGPSMFAFQFNGAEHGKNFITLPRGLSARMPRTMTLEAWIWLPEKSDRSDATALPLLSRFNQRLRTGPSNLDSQNDFSFEIDSESDNLRFWMGGQSVDYGFDLSSSSSVPTGEWSHVAVSVLSSESGNPFFALLFINGVQVGTQNWAQGATRVFQANEAIAVGHRASGDDEHYFEGVMDDVRIWTSARKAEDIMAQMKSVLSGEEEGLLALYKLDDFGDRLVHDAGLYGLHGYTLKALPTLGDSMTLQRREKGVQGFPVEVVLGAVDLVPTAPDGFEYTLSCLPEHGCVSEPGDEKVQCAKPEDLGSKIFTSNIHFTADADYMGEDKICYQARRVGESTFSPATEVIFDVIEAPDTGCVTVVDECGVCGGDGSSCRQTSGGCDGKGGQFDECMVCGGDGSTCTCAVYKSYKLDEMDCVLFDNAINRTMVRIENSVRLLTHTLDGLAVYDPEDGCSQLDLLIQIKHICAVRECVSEYADELAVFDDYITEYLKTAPLCEVEPEPKLLGYFERRRMDI